MMRDSKGEWHEMDIVFDIFEGLNILISTYSVCADDFQDLSKAFHIPCTIINFIFASLKSLTNFENAY
jgi:hypothetical protein